MIGALQQHRAFTLWRLDPHPVPGKKPLKVSTHADVVTNHSRFNPAPPLTWAEADAAVQQARAWGLGHDRAGEPGYVGLGFRPAGTGLACLDIDDCIVGGAWSPRALEMMAAFPGAGLELSHSGKGLHIWFRYTGEGPGHRGRDASGTLELYSEGQFLALGTPLQGDAGTDHTAAMLAVLAAYWPPKPAAKVVTANDWAEKTPEQRDATKAQILDACRVLPQNDYLDWVSIGMRLSSLGDEGAELWHEVSSWWPGYSYDEAQAKWEQLAADSTDYRALFAAAQRLGWVNPASTEARIASAMAGFGVEQFTPPNPRPAPATPAPSATNLIAPPALSFAAAAGGAIAATLPNVLDALRSTESGITIARDEFKDTICIGTPGGAWRTFEDEDYTMLRAEMERRGFKSISPEIMKSSVKWLARERRFDSAMDWANALRWDGVPRVTMALHRFYGVADTAYTRAVSEYLFTALGGRCLDPGCQADMALILVGLQGARKTSAVSALCPTPETFVEVDLGERDKDLSRRLRGKLVAELAEMRGLVGREQEAIKAWVSRRKESMVEKFETFERVYQRRFVCIGTANTDELLDDPTGERRWLPMHAGTTDVEGLTAAREQLWAEGVAMWRAGGVRWQEAERLAKAEHDAFKVGDVMLETVAAYLAERPNALEDGFESEVARATHPIDLKRVIRFGLLIPLDRIDRKTETRAGKIMKLLGYEKHNLRIGGMQAKRWVKG